MQLLVKLLTDHVLNKARPALDQNRCINTKQHRVHCSTCEDTCPYHVLDDITAPDFTQCVDCVICVSACPAAALSYSAPKINYLLECTKKDANTLRLGCHLSAEYTDISLPCLASFPTEFFIILNLQGIRIEFVAGNCSECEYCSQMNVFQKNAHLSAAFLNKDVPELTHINESFTPIGHSRREAFSLMLKKSKGFLSDLANTLPQDLPLGDFWKALLIKQLQKSNIPTARWLAPVIENCHACDVCIKLCPNQALSLDASSDEKRMVHYGWKCRGCNLCKSICPWKCITSFNLVEVTPPDQPVVIPLKNADISNHS